MRTPPRGPHPANPYRESRSSGPRCPADGYPLELTSHGSGQQYRRCGACGGVWIDSEALNALLAWEIARAPRAAVEPSASVARAYEMARQKFRDDLKCPECGAEMVAEEHRRDSFILVDICPSGCGKWLDDDELRLLIDDAIQRPR